MPTTDPVAGSVSWSLLVDGAIVKVRTIRPADHDAVIRLHKELSPDNQYLRFFGISVNAPFDVSRRICRPPDQRHHAVGVWLGDALIGVAHYERPSATSLDAEMAFVVADSMHGKGVATLLLERLASEARAAGVRQLTAEVLARNAPMLRVFADAGLTATSRFDREVVQLVADLDGGERYLDAVADRERRSQEASLAHVFHPRSVVVVGASDRTGNVGGIVVRNLIAAGYDGDLAIVHPRGASVGGVKGVMRLGLVPFPLDLVVLAVPAGTLAEVIDECGQLGARAAVILTSGLRPEEGQRVRDIGHYHGMRIVGPNCVGIAQPSSGLDLTFAAKPLTAGSAGVAAQSGGLGLAVADQLSRLGIGVSTFVSLGDKYDVSATDLLQVWQDDEETKLAVLYVESFGNPRKFAHVARRLSARKPVLVVDEGRSAPAQRGAMSHTAAAATPYATRQALFADAGVIAVPDFGDLVGALAFLGSQPLPEGARVAVISNAGGAGILAADACSDAGLTLPELTESTRVQVQGLLPFLASVGNPTDASAGCDRRSLLRAAEVLAADPHVDAVVVLPVPTGLDDMSTIDWPELRKPIIGVRLNQAERVRNESTVEGGRVPVYAAPRDAAVALAKTASYFAWRECDSGQLPSVPGLSLADARAVVRAYLAEHPEGGWLPPDQAVAVVAASGVAPVPTRVVDSVVAAGAAAVELGFPVVMKAAGPTLVHKAHAQGVVLGLGSEPEVVAAYERLASLHGDAMTSVVVQSMTGGEVELLVGMNSDPVFGPIVAFGLGGTEADALADRVVRLAPLTDVAAAEMVRGIRSAKLLDVAASGGPVDTTALRDLLLRIASLADGIPELADIDLNPVLARREGLALVDVKVRVAPRATYDPFLRTLR